MHTLILRNPIQIESLFSKSNNLRILCLAPHPDDFDAVGATMRFLMDNTRTLEVAVATSGASGVEDSYCPTPKLEAKGKLRELEQKASCEFFGLPESNLEFLRLEEDIEGHPVYSEDNMEIIQQHFKYNFPNIVFLPHWNDTNQGHRRIHSMFIQVASAARYPIAAFLNRDPKTIQMYCDFYFGYKKEIADWKGKMLRFHRSQHMRNLNQRGHGFDERILNMDLDSAAVCKSGTMYAEAFELELHGIDNFSNIF